MSEHTHTETVLMPHELRNTPEIRAVYASVMAACLGGSITSSWATPVAIDNAHEMATKAVEVYKIMFASELTRIQRAIDDQISAYRATAIVFNPDTGDTGEAN